MRTPKGITKGIRALHLHIDTLRRILILFAFLGHGGRFSGPHFDTLRDSDAEEDQYPECRGRGPPKGWGLKFLQI